jgi:hypothetical protein
MLCPFSRPLRWSVPSFLRGESGLTAEDSAQRIGRNQSLCVPPSPPRLIVHSTAEDAEVRRASCQKSKKSRVCIAEARRGTQRDDLKRF